MSPRYGAWYRSPGQKEEEAVTALYDSTKADVPYMRWWWIVCRRCDFSGRLWPSRELCVEMYDAGLTVTEAMLKAYPDWSPGR